MVTPAMPLSASSCASTLNTAMSCWWSNAFMAAASHVPPIMKMPMTPICSRARRLALTMAARMCVQSVCIAKVPRQVAGVMGLQCWRQACLMRDVQQMQHRHARDVGTPG